MLGRSISRSVVGMTLGLLVSAGVVRAQCPTACIGGGGPAATDCFLAWGNAPAKVVLPQGWLADRDDMTVPADAEHDDSGG